MLEIDRERLLALAERVDADGEGLTTIQWSEALGISLTKTRVLIGKAVQSGLMTLSKRVDEAHWSGRAQPYTVYRMVKPGQSK